MKYYIMWIALFLVVMGAATCTGLLTSGQEAKGALVNAGYSDIHLTHAYHFFADFRGCGTDDQAKYVFTAKNPSHQLVTVSVCEGWPFKGATIRYGG